MKIYVGHASSFDFKQELYGPIKSSILFSQHTFIFPHDEQADVQNSREWIQSSDLFIAEVSYPSTGLGIEMGWASAQGIPIVAIFRKDHEPSSSMQFVAKQIVEYTDSSDLIKHIQTFFS